MRFRQGSIPFLLAHELRLTWRGWRGRRLGKAAPKARRRRIRIPGYVFIIAILVAATFLIGVPVAKAVQGTNIPHDPVAVVIADLAVMIIFTLMLSQTLMNAVQAFYERGDFDLLLSSPISPTRVLTVRTLSIAVSPAILVCGLLTPLLLPLAVFGHAELLGNYLIGGALALLASSAGIGLALVLFKVIGPRRTRTVAQILAALVGALFVLIANAPNLLGEEGTGNLWQRMVARAAKGELSITGPLSFPARAAFGEPVPLLIICAVSIGFFVLIARVVGRRFAESTAAAQGAAVAPQRRTAGREHLRFTGGAFRAVLTKEIRLLRRDPALIAQILLRIFYLIPVTFAITRSSSEVVGFGFAAAAGAVTLLAGQMAGSIAWITISAEDSPQLLVASPYPIGFFWRAKFVATLLPPSLLVIPAVIALFVLHPMAGIGALIGAVASSGSAGLVNLWLQKPARRQEFRRQARSNLASTLLELLLSLCWAIATGLFVFGLYLWALVPTAIALVVLLLCRRSEAAMVERLSAA